uniref:Uncharacterized protein n=1 Tax=Arundo donax TaxID=35708 RepID=A0A0A9B8K2_ARUDO
MLGSHLQQSPFTIPSSA